MSSRNFLYVGQFRDSSGYASAARSYLKAVDASLLKSEENINFKVYTVPIEHTSSLTKEEEALLKKYELTNEDVDEFLMNDYTMVWHMPPSMIMIGQNFVEPIYWNNVVKLLENSSKNINMTVWEASSVPDQWNESVYKTLKTDSIIVPSSWNLKVFSEGISSIDCNLLPHVIHEPSLSRPQISKLEERLKNKFVIFTMSQWQSRKGFDKLIQSYCMEFKDEKDVVLVIKTYGNLMKSNPVSVKEQASQIAKDIKNYKDQVFLPNSKKSEAEIILLPYVLPFSEISALQSRADLFALLTRAEGFGLTIAEAVTHQTPVLVPDQGGHVDYLDKENSFLVTGHWSPYIGKPEYNSDMIWYEPHILSARANMRKAYNLWKHGKLKDIGKKSKENLKNMGFDELTIGRRFLEILKSRNKKPELQNINATKVRDKVLQIKNIYRLLKDDYTSKINLLHNLFEGEDCYILTCGPSIKEYDFDYIKEKLKDKLGFTVKQTIDDFEEISDFHFFNSNNFSKFNNSSCISVASSAEFRPIMENNVWKNQDYDIFLKILQDKDYDKTVAVANSFDKWLLENSIKRPWGPGIMYESVLHFAYHLGVKNIYTLGWDLESPGTLKSRHYYDKSVKNIVRPADSMRPKEIADNILASANICAWLESKNVNLYVATENSYVHEKVERKKI